MAEPGSLERVVPVEILGRKYPIRSGLDADYVAALAAYVDEKMRAASDITPSGDPLRLAILAALNIADDFFRCRAEGRLDDSKLVERTAAMERMLDQVLGRLTPAGEGQRSEHS
ncbi:MAG: cell division protein ZapA [Vicinamibacterales bacterium]